MPALTKNSEPQKSQKSEIEMDHSKAHNDKISAKLADLPFQIFLHVADADHNIDAKEISQFRDMLHDDSWLHSQTAKNIVYTTRDNFEQRWDEFKKIPGIENFEAIEQAINYINTNLPFGEKKSLKSDMLWLAKKIASASGGFVGIYKVSNEEQSVLNDLEVLFENTIEWKKIESQYFETFCKYERSFKFIKLASVRAEEILESLIKILKFKDLPARPIQIYVKDFNEQSERVILNWVESSSKEKGHWKASVIFDSSAKKFRFEKDVIAIFIRIFLGKKAALNQELLEGLFGYLYHLNFGGEEFTLPANFTNKVSENNDLLNVELLKGKWEFDQSKYPLAITSFVGFLIETYGPDRYKQLLVGLDKNNIEKAVESVLHISVGVLEQEWLHHLQDMLPQVLGIGGFIKKLLPFMRSFWFSRSMIILAIGVQLAYSTLMPFGYKLMFDEALHKKDTTFLAIIIFAMGIAFIIRASANILQDYFTANLGTRVLNKVRKDLFKKLQRLNSYYFQKHETGRIMSRFSHDLDIIDNAIRDGMPNATYQFFLLLLSTVLLFKVESTLAWIALVGLVLVFFAPRYLMPIAARTSYERNVNQAKLSAIVHENISIHHLIRTFGLEKNRLKYYQKNLNKLAINYARAAFFSSLLSRVAQLGMSFVQLIIIAVGAYLTFEAEITLGSLAGFIALLANVGLAAEGLTKSLPIMVHGASSWRHIEDILNEKVEINDGERSEELPPFSDKIEFKDVFFSYETHEKSLKKLNLTINKGESLGVVGASGSGKSIFIYLLTRLYDPTRGTVSIDGIDLKSVTQKSVLAHFGIVLQENAILNASIADNIRVGNLDAQIEDIEVASRLAELHEFVVGLPNGYDTLIGEGGAELSIGMRQRLAITRVFLRDPSIIVLDEATSSLDMDNERVLGSVLNELISRRTTIFTSHRLENVFQLDRILVFDEGELIEDGSHEQLIDRRGYYYHLWQKQHGFTIDESGNDIRVKPRFLREIPLLKKLDLSLLTDLTKHLKSLRVPQGQFVFHEGEKGDLFYIIARGRIEVVTKRADGVFESLSVLGDGDFFGEVALLKELPRNASIRTLTPCIFLTLSQKDFINFLTGTPNLVPEFKALLKTRMVQ